jgi:hypothetical protein
MIIWLIILGLLFALFIYYIVDKLEIRLQNFEKKINSLVKKENFTNNNKPQPVKSNTNNDDDFDNFIKELENTKNLSYSDRKKIKKIKKTKVIPDNLNLNLNTKIMTEKEIKPFDNNDNFVSV